jgi:hypothetical protein
MRSCSKNFKFRLPVAYREPEVMAEIVAPLPFFLERLLAPKDTGQGKRNIRKSKIFAKEGFFKFTPNIIC